MMLFEATIKKYPEPFAVWREVLGMIEQSAGKRGRDMAGPYARAIEILLLQCYKSLISVGILAGEGLAEDAAGSARRLLEIGLQAEHLAADSSSRKEKAQRFLAYFWAYLCISGLGDSAYVRSTYAKCKHLVELNDFGQPKNWWGGSVANLAKSVGRMDTYAEDYAYLSQMTHATPAGVAPDSFSGDGLRVRTTELAPALVTFASGYALASFARWNEQFSVAETEAVEEVSVRVQKLKSSIRLAKTTEQDPPGE